MAEICEELDPREMNHLIDIEFYIPDELIVNDFNFTSQLERA